MKNPVGWPGGGAGRGPIDKSLDGLATSLALVAAIACSGPIFEYSLPVAFGFLNEAYGEEMLATLGAYLFSALCTVAVFHIARIAIVLSLGLIAMRGLAFI